MQAGQDRDGNDGTGSLDCPTQWRILARRQVRADLTVVRIRRSFQNSQSDSFH
jgi:hypothetical protein